MNENTNTLNWFEIPVADFARAKKIYETIFSISMQEMDFEGFRMGMFPSVPGNGKLSGAICHGPGYKPSAEGCLIYLNGDPDRLVIGEKKIIFHQ